MIRLPMASVALLLAAGSGAGKPAVTAPGQVRLRLHGEVAVHETMRVDGGVIRGVREGAVLAFRGVPFAAPPLAALRWRPPLPVAPWPDVRPADSFPPRCPQLDEQGAVIGDEDCLYLNLWTPEGATSTSELPVLFFIHGGGHVQGSASEQTSDGTFLYDGSALAERAGAVVVTTQYRLGPLGFVAHPAFAAESAEGIAGNYGTLDEIAALQWVRGNVRRFGGDPGRVLVFGESAGAVETCMLLVSPRAAGLFRAALMESGGCGANDATKAMEVAVQLAAAAGCGDAADVAGCLRALPLPTLMTALPGSASTLGPQSGYQPNVDGVVIPGDPLAVIAAGAHNRVPLVVGANADETALETVTVVTEAQYRGAVRELAGGSVLLANLILNRYPISEYGGSPRKAFTALTSDVSFICTARRVARAAAAGQGEPVFRYYFTHPWDNAGELTRALGAFHGIELAYVFDHLQIAGYQASAAEMTLRDAIVASWRNLAANGDPSPAGGPAWPPYDAVSDPFLELDPELQAGWGVRKQQCDFWDSLLP